MEEPSTVRGRDGLGEFADERESIEQVSVLGFDGQDVVEAELRRVALEDERGAQLVLVELLRASAMPGC